MTLKNSLRELHVKEIIMYDPQYDLNRDGFVDQLDIDIAIQYMNTAVNPNDPISVQADFNHDGYIDELDFSLLAARQSPRTSNKFAIIAGTVLVAGILLLVANENKKRLT
jgi:hypothetical protein